MYVVKFYFDQFEQEIVKIFELIDVCGNYYWYNLVKVVLLLMKFFDWILVIVVSIVQCCWVVLDKKFCFFFCGGMYYG